jgi:hypothetical protein
MPFKLEFFKTTSNEKIIKNDLIHNLSTIALSDTDISVLEKGLGFIPTPKLLPISNILQDKDTLIRNIKLKCYFNNNNNNNNNNNDNINMKTRRFCDKSTWVPNNLQLFRNGSLETYLNIINNMELKTNEIVNSNKTIEKAGNKYICLSDKYNLSNKEFLALKKLGNNENLTIKPADKGGALVLMDTDLYLKEAYRQLNDINYYVKLNKPIYTDNRNKIEAILNDMYNDKIINNKQLQYLAGPHEPRLRRFYILPKIHKDPLTWTIPHRMPQGRPIVSDVESESYRISAYVESFLTPLSCRHESYIKNSYDFIDKIRDLNISANTYLVTGDITSLYTNMKHDITIDSIKKILNKYPELNRPDNYILKILELILKNNDFEFNNEVFLQTCGCPMGKIIGPAAANIYLIDFDEAAMNGFRIKPEIFFRFLDDVFLFWNGTLQDLKEYENFLNSLIPGIKITLEANLISANFLDITIYKKHLDNNNIKIATKVYVKPTDTQNLLHTSSFHPPHTTKGILKSQLIRYKRISSSYEDYLQSAKLLFNNLKNRGYTFTQMRRQFKHIWFDYIDNSNKNNNKTNIFPIVINYDSVGRLLGKTYRDILSNTPLFDNHKIIVAYKNHNNIHKLLINSKINVNLNDNNNNNTNNNTIFYSKRCNSARCKTCNYIVESTHFISNTTKRKYNLLNNFNCKSKNIIYLITCSKCYKQYVGQTSRTLADRLTNHLSCIRHNKNTPISIHFNQPNHSINHLKIMAIEQNTASQKQLDIKEKHWQHTLQTLYPLGINHTNVKY